MNRHPHGCQCSICRGSHCAPACDAFLLPKIMGSGRECYKRVCQEIKVTGISECAEPPFNLVNVTQSGSPVCVTRLPDKCGRNQMLFCLQIPLTVQICDAKGCMYTGCASITVEAALNTHTCRDECPCCQVIAMAAVRLVCAPPPSCDLCFEAAMEVRTEIYLVRYEPCQKGTAPKCPPFPDKPLYPHMPCDC